MDRLSVKICGLSTPETVTAALNAGADMVGFVYFPKSPRHIDLETMAALADQARSRSSIVVLTVNADHALMRSLVTRVRPDWVQMHGHEDAGRIEVVRARFGTKIMKAVGIGSESDVTLANSLGRVADRLLVDAKPAEDATRPGGLGEVFDWGLLDSLDRTQPFMLSGGLTAANVAQAIERTRAHGVDVSSGVESAPGIKDALAIEAFIKAARGGQKVSPPDPSFAAS
ncbi:MAG: phosphoribosylanthranilate isomerase [Pseudomonadota bacterium]